MSMTGMFATSKAGHDKGQLYIIIKEDEEYVYLTDGRLKPVDGPKKKKKKHIQIIKKTDAAIQARIKEEKPLSNEIIKHAIREYKEAERAGRDAAEPGTAVARTAHSAELETAVPRTAHR